MCNVSYNFELSDNAFHVQMLLLESWRFMTKTSKANDFKQKALPVLAVRECAEDVGEFDVAIFFLNEQGNQLAMLNCQLEPTIY